MTHNTWADKSSLGVSPGQRSPPSGRSPGGTHLLQSRTPPPQGQAAWSAPLTWEGVPEAPSRALVTMLPCTGTAVSTHFLSPQAAHRSVHEPAHLPCGWRHAGRGATAASSLCIPGRGSLSAGHMHPERCDRHSPPGSSFYQGLPG